MAKHVIWIIDGSYMNRAAPGRFDYLKLKSLLVGPQGGDFVETYFLNCASPSLEGFHTWLKTAPPGGPKMQVQLYRMKEMNCKCPKCNVEFGRPVQKGVDVAIATLIIKLASQGKYDRLLLSTGDGDFEDAIRYVKNELHKELFLAGFKGTVSADLQSYANKVIWLDEYWEEIAAPGAVAALAARNGG